MDEADQYELTRLNDELVTAAAAGRYRQAGKVVTRIMQLQHAAGVLPGRPELEAIKADLDQIPSRILGVRR